MMFSNDSNQWYVKRTNQQIGPFTYVEIVRQMQEKVLLGSDLICQMPELEHWEKISESEYFKPENVRELLKLPAPEVQKIFFKRLPRVPYQSEVVVHMNKDSFSGHSIELSANGAGLLIDDENQGLHIGLNIFLFFKVSDAVPKFNAIGTIVNKQHLNNYPGESKYGIKFLNISKDIREAIKSFTENSVLDSQGQPQKKAA